MVEFDDLIVNNVLTLGDVDLSGANSVLTINDSFHSDKPYHNFCRIATTDGTYNCGLDFYRDYGGGNQTHFAIHHYNRICILTEGLSFNLENPVGTSYFQVLSSGQARLPATGSEGGLLIGGDANLYRSAADTLKTDDSLDIQSGDNIAQHGLLINTGWINHSDYTECMPFDVKIRGTRCVYIQTDGALCANKVIESREHWQHLSKQQFMAAVDGHTFLDTTGKIRFYDLDEYQGGHEDIILHGVMSGDYPTLVCSQSLAVEKDFIAKGMLDSFEGEVVLNGGNYAPYWSYEYLDHTPHTTGGAQSTANPFIWLAQGGWLPGGSYGSYNTLEIRVTADENGNWNWGNLACGDIGAHGMLDSFEGEVVLNGGNYAPAWSWQNHTTGGVATTKNPFIWLAQGGIFGSYNTLEIRVTADENGNWNWGNLVCGELTIKSVANTTARGPLYLTSDGKVGYNTSSMRFKEDIEDWSDCSWLYDLRPVIFDWKEEQRKQSEGRQMGLIAEEVNELCPQLVFFDNEGKPEGVHYEWLGVPLIVEIKKLRHRIEALETQLKQNAAAA